jgi:outer membrane protein
MNTRIIKISLIALTSVASLTFARAQKIAHINVDSLVSTMAETKVASEAAQSISNSLNQEMIAMQTEFESKYKDYLEKEATMSDLLKKNRQEELQQLEKRTADFRTQASQDYQRRTAELTAPIMAKAKKAIEMVAKEAGYKYVLDTSPQATLVLYSEPSDDILIAVKKKLDTMPAAVIPGSLINTGGMKPSQGGANKPPTPKGK